MHRTRKNLLAAGINPSVLVRAPKGGSTAFRLALTYGVLLVLTMSIVLSVFYVQTVGVLRMRMDRQAENHMRRLVEHRFDFAGLTDARGLEAHPGNP